MGFPDSSVGKESACNAGDLGLIPGLGRSPGERKARWEKMGTTEDEMVGWHHLLNGQEFEQAPAVGDGQGGLACCGL